MKTSLKHHRINRKTGEKEVSVTRLIRAYFYAQNSNKSGMSEKLEHLKKHLSQLEWKERKKLIREAAIREMLKAKNDVYKLFLDYVIMFGEL